MVVVWGGEGGQIGQLVHFKLKLLRSDEKYVNLRFLIENVFLKILNKYFESLICIHSFTRSGAAGPSFKDQTETRPLRFRNLFNLNLS